MWHLTRFAMKNRALTIFLATLLAAGAVWATFQLKLELIPDIEVPFTMVVTAYPNATPEEVANEVSLPIEGVIMEQWEGRGLRHVYATSADGISVIFAEFDYGTDMKEVKASVERGISAAELDLPDEVRNLPQMDPRISQNPQIAELDPSMMPLVIFSLTGDRPSEELGAIALTEIVPELKKVPDIISVEIEGGEKDQVLITPNPEVMNEHGISMGQMLSLLAAVPEYGSLSEVESLATGIDGVALGDVASVGQGPAPRTRISRTDGETSVGIAVFKHKGSNTVEVANAVVERVEELNKALADDLEISAVFDQSEFIEKSISELTRMALIGAALAIVIVFVFLAAFRASLVTAMSIPASILIGFLAMYLAGITINMLTLSAMAIAVGRLIDNSIVIAEVVYRRMRQGQGFLEASIEGSREIAGPITASTLATVAIFIPLIFVGGMVGELFLPFALTITFALVASLLVALMVVPAFSKWFVGSRGVEKERQDGVREAWYQRVYAPSLRWALGHRFLTLAVAGILFLGSGALLPIIGTSFLPSMSEKMLVVEVELPAGTEIETTSQVTALIEMLLAGNDQVESFHTIIGTSTTSVHAAMAAAMGGGDNTAEITILLDPGADESKEQEDIELAVEAMSSGDYRLSDFVTILSGDEAMGGQMGFGSGLDVSVSGDSQEAVSQATNLLVERFRNLDGVSNLETDLSKVVPRLDIELNPDEVAARGFTERQLSGELFLMMMGQSVEGVSVSIDGDSFGIYLKGAAGQLGFAESPEQALVRARQLLIGGSEPVTLGEVAAVDLPLRPTHIGHIDQKLAVSITGDITEKNVGAVNRLVDDEIAAVEQEVDGVEIQIGGVAEQMAESFSKMGTAIMVAMLIAYLILVVSMRSLLNPLIIMVSLPLASIGALLGLLATGHTLGMSGMMGVLMLVGIVLTNAIVLIALVEQLRKKGVNTYDALMESGNTRLRPILMTALTTMFAMLPLAFGVGGGTLLAAELAVVVIGGLFSSTLLTLLVIPVIYSLVDGLRQRRRRAA